MLVTTSRYSSKETRVFAKKLAKTTNSGYIARGKKSIDSIVSLARKKGHDKISVIVEKSSKPDCIDFISVNANGTWVWENNRVMIRYEDQ